MNVTTREAAWDCVVESIVEMLRDQGEEPDEVKPAQLLVGDLGIASVNIIHLMVTMEDKLDHPLNFRKLAMRNGDALASDLTVGELHQFVCESLSLDSAGPGAA
jgi:acyl carrier protein